MSASQPHQKMVMKPQTPGVRVVGPTSHERRPAGVQVEYRGLCSTCIHASTCTFPRSKDHPVRFCEEFDGQPAEPVLTVVSHEHQPNQEALADRKRYLGLCSTCQRRETCTFPKHEGGVWQCEEFE